MPSWHFAERRPVDKVRDSTLDGFFTNEAIDRPGEVLIREGIQNSLDAADGGAVKIRVFLSGDEGAVCADELEPYMNGAWEHFHADGNGLSDVPSPSAPCPFLVFEDFGTIGLQGDTREAYPGKSRNPFFYFFRAEGRSDKSEQDRGRWGVGKYVFLQASQVKAFLGVTVRADDRKRLLMGQAVLRSHSVNTRHYLPDGWYGEREEGKPVMPMEEPAPIVEFCRVFALEREEKAGLSIVVPWYSPEITENALIEAVVRGYFYPILKRSLSVVVETPSRKTCLDSQSICRVVQRLGSDSQKELQPVVELAAWACENGTSVVTVLPRTATKHAPKWTADLVPDEQCVSLRDMLDAGKPTGIRVPVLVRRKEGASEWSSFDVFMKRRVRNEAERPKFIRNGIAVPEVRPRRTQGYSSLVVIEDKPLATLLGDAENPSHTRWENTAQLKHTYTYGKSYTTFVANSVNELIRVLSDSEEQEDTSLLGGYFSLPPVEDEETTTSTIEEPRARPGTQSRKGLPPIPTPPPLRFRIQRVCGGFSVMRGDAATPPRFIDIQVAYDVRNGNSLKKYHPADFDLGKAQIHCEGVKIARCEENRIHVKVLRPKFRVDVRGFDEQRDLYVRATTREASNDD